MDQQYRALSPDEIIQEGDEIILDGNEDVWTPCCSTIGKFVKDESRRFNRDYRFRRPIPVAKSEAPKELYRCVKCGSHFTDPDTLGMPWACDNCGNSLEPVPPVSKSATGECPGPDCQMCSGEYCAIHMGDPCDCDVIDRHKIAPISPVKESLSVEDESSDNSRSFQEIERLNRVIESLRKQHKNRNPTYAPCSICSHLYPEQMLVEATCSACWKLQAEKAEALRDTAYSARDAFADLYTKECELRRQAERERDEAIKTRQEVEQRLLHAETELAEIYMAFGYPDPSDSEDIGPSDVREVVVKERDALRAERDEAVNDRQTIFDKYESLTGEHGELKVRIHNKTEYADALRTENIALRANPIQAALAGKGESK